MSQCKFYYDFIKVTNVAFTLKKKAFTLPEVLISMSILVIVLALVSALVLVVNRVTQTQSSNRLCEDEYLKTSQLVSLFVDTYSVIPFVIDDETQSLLK